MKKDSSSNSEDELLSSKEWDFSEVEDDELYQCYLWEYGREIEKWRNIIIGYRETLLKEKFKLTNQKQNGNEYNDYFYFGNNKKPQNHPEFIVFGKHPVLPEGIFLYSSEWPDKSYLSLSKLERQRRIRILITAYLDSVGTDYIGYEDWDENFRGPYYFRVPVEVIVNNETIINKFKYDKENQELNEGLLPNSIRLNSGRNEWSVFNIDWTKSKAELIKQFKRWVEITPRPPVKGKVDKRGGGSDIRKMPSKLRFLGAYRLLQKMKWEDAADYTENVCGKHFYDNQSAWSRAKKEAEKEIQFISSKKYF